ncbi:MAG: hypothetical protein R3C10_16315 [Pirellulales bacterium]
MIQMKSHRTKIDAESRNPYVSPSTAHTELSGDAPAAKRGASATETATMTFLIALVCLVLFPGSSKPPLGSDKLPGFLLLPSPYQVGWAGYVALSALASFALAVLVGVPHSVILRSANSPASARVAGYFFITAAFTVGVVGAMTVFGR